MLNQELKERFIKESDLVESTQKNFRYILKKGGTTEDEFNKDICEFTPYECDQLLFSFSARSESMVFVLVSCFRQYVDFCKSNNLTRDDFNYFSTITGSENVRSYVDKTVSLKKYITYEELLEMEELCVNAQDAVIPELLFLGIKGEQAAEIRDLEISQIREDKIILPNREIPISDRSYNLILDAYNQRYFIKGNGETDAKSTKMSIPPGNKILRSAGNKATAELGYPTFQLRIIRIKDYFGNPYLTATNIWMSGMIHLAKQIKLEKGELEKEDWIFLNKRFGYGEAYWSQSKLRISNYI